MIHTSGFNKRHTGLSTNDVSVMLHEINCDTIEQLIDQTLPDTIRLTQALAIPDALSEYDALEHLKKLGSMNILSDNYIGYGYHPTITPAVIQRNILENPGWYTAYTPYQAEIAQGRLEALLNFQTMVMDLTAMPIANAALLDEATAAAEAMFLLYQVRTPLQKKSNATKFYVDQGVLPQTLAVIHTRSNGLGIEIITGNAQNATLDDTYFGVLIAYPNQWGGIEAYHQKVAEWKNQDIKTAVTTDLLALTLLSPPGEWGADVVVGSTQRLGIPMGYGGPHAAFFSTLEAYKRFIPGRIIGVSEDQTGNKALRMALQTREQHIKRDKATSNICTSQVLLAVMAGMYAVYHGPAGLKAIAQQIHQNTVILAQTLKIMGFTVQFDVFFDTIALSINESDRLKLQRMAVSQNINLNYFVKNTVLIALNETTNKAKLNTLIKLFFSLHNDVLPTLTSTVPDILKPFARKSDFLTHFTFNAYHSESEMMRYIKSLENKDLSLTHSMIALGSCTMKLNAASELFHLSWPEFGNLHPFCPKDQAKGYQLLIEKLEQYLNTITGFAATSLQPNSGAQGEYAGLMVIDAYHKSKGNGHRNVALIPASAHGTNPASAAIAGMKIVIVNNSEDGPIDFEDLKTKVFEHSDNLSCLMVTYPSTYGVFDEEIKAITALIHEHGGQVYMDGANMNAQVGITNPATIGADVCHLNLHKTFAIPHGGGGPGIGPICVAQHLAPFLPTNPNIPTGGNQAISAISAAPYGSAFILPISYMYIIMSGYKGLTINTQFSILSANYLKSKLEKHYPVLYKNTHNRVAHEMILDCRPFKSLGIEVVDIAKRLMDYGFHAPTVSFPVAGTLMIEPTESESLREIDRFIDALVNIRFEIAAIETDNLSTQNNVLKNAPHTLAVLTSDEWNLPYTRNQAAYPLPWIKNHKFWPSVSRIKEAEGDRNLICSCLPTESYL